MAGAPDDTARDPAAERPAPLGVLVGIGGDPLTVGLIFFGIASLALGMALIGMPTAAQGAVIPIILLGSGLYQLIVTVWAIVIGQSIVAVIFSTFSAFWLSFSALLLGLDHRWFGIGTADVTGTRELFFIAWACLFLFLIVPCLKLPLVYPVAVALVFAAVSLAAIGAFTGSADIFTAAGAVALTFAFLAFYAWVNVALVAAGGKALPPLGRPPIR
jgi:uncharacterized protein